jgi:uncharacterized protein with NRDE domain
LVSFDMTGLSVGTMTSKGASATMCLILLAWRAHSNYPVVLAANRDEYHARPSAAATWWPGPAGILAGRDLKQGGTWLGVTRAGRFAALTNYRGPAAPRPDAPSRGGLVSEALESSQDIFETLVHLRRIAPHYNPFNMMWSDGQRLGIFESTRGEGRELGPGIYGLSNHLLDTPWPKVQNAKSRLAEALAGSGDESALLHLLRDDEPAPDSDLPSTGIAVEWERLLSSAFVRAIDYGTRSSTVLRIDAEGHARFDEWSWDREGRESGRLSYRFEIERGGIAS